jgi:hypothetical protein
MGHPTRFTSAEQAEEYSRRAYNSRVIGATIHEESEGADKVGSVNLDLLVSALESNNLSDILKATNSKTLKESLEIIFAYESTSTIIPWGEDDTYHSDELNYFFPQKIRDSAKAFLDRKNSP